jgi:hypothetical protein
LRFDAEALTWDENTQLEALLPAVFNMLSGMVALDRWLANIPRCLFVILA